MIGIIYIYLLLFKIHGKDCRRAAIFFFFLFTFLNKTRYCVGSSTDEVKDEDKYRYNSVYNGEMSYGYDKQNKETRIDTVVSGKTRSVELKE